MLYTPMHFTGITKPYATLYILFSISVSKCFHGVNNILLQITYILFEWPYVGKVRGSQRSKSNWNSPISKSQI